LINIEEIKIVTALQQSINASKHTTAVHGAVASSSSSSSSSLVLHLFFYACTDWKVLRFSPINPLVVEGAFGAPPHGFSGKKIRCGIGLFTLSTS